MNKKKIDMHGKDSMVQCEKCGRKQFLNFANGLRNGWDLCCGYTMTLKIHPDGDAISKAVGVVIDSQIPKWEKKSMSEEAAKLANKPIKGELY